MQNTLYFVFKDKTPKKRNDLPIIFMIWLRCKVLANKTLFLYYFNLYQRIKAVENTGNTQLQLKIKY